MMSPIGGGHDSPAAKTMAVTPSDSTDLTGVRGLYVGATGDVSVRCIQSPDTTVVFASVPAGSILPIMVTRVMSATTASSIVALY